MLKNLDDVSVFKSLEGAPFYPRPNEFKCEIAAQFALEVRGTANAPFRGVFARFRLRIAGLFAGNSVDACKQLPGGWGSATFLRAAIGRAASVEVITVHTYIVRAYLV